MKTESFPTPWQTLGTVPVADLVEAKVQLHWAAQIVAAFGNGLLQPRSDDSQSNLGWIHVAPYAAIQPRMAGASAFDLQISLYFFSPPTTPYRQNSGYQDKPFIRVLNGWHPRILRFLGPHFRNPLPYVNTICLLIL